MKDIISTLELVEEHIDRLASKGIYEIERDLLLERLRNLYSEVLYIEPKCDEIDTLDAFLAMQTLDEVEELREEEVEEEPQAEEEPQVEEEEVYNEAFEEEVAVAAEPEVEEPIEEQVVEPEESYEEEPTAEEEPAEEENLTTEEENLTTEEEPTEEVKSAPAMLGEIDHQAAMSLYDDDEEDEVPTDDEQEVVEEPALEEEAEEEIVEEAEEERVIEPIESGKVLAEVLATEQVTVADSLAEEAPDDVAMAATASLSLRQAIGVNDKFILMRDLFAGNSDYYGEAIDKLDSFENLDEAMLYIYDNFHWNPNSEGARLLMELLARKLF